MIAGPQAESSSLGWRVDAGLIDGAGITVRPLRREDTPELRSFFAGMSPESVRLRYFSSTHNVTDKELATLTSSDVATHVHLGAFHAEVIVAVGDYYVTSADEAEVGFAVADAFQGRGVGSLLVEYLAVTARSTGISRLVADTLADNRRMLDVFRHAGFIERVSAPAMGVISVSLDIRDVSGARAANGERERLAAVAAVRQLLSPRSVAVIGAGRASTGVGREIFGKLLRGGFHGRLFPVNPNTDTVCGVPTHASVSDIPGGVDLAVIAVPAVAVLTTVKECGEAGVKSLVVISSGFSEIGREGAALEHRMLEMARRYGMRVVGPNCMGIINTDPSVGLDATFAPTQARPGNVAFFTQSGALGIAILDEAERLGIGLSSFVSAGNKVDISGNDLLQYWEQDPRTDVILLYLESFGNPRRFAEIARRVSTRKPIVAVKGLRSRAGARAAASPAAPAASPENSVDALFRQAGVIRVTSLEQLFDVGRVLACSPAPRGNRVAVVGNAGGAGLLTADACEAAGLQVPALSDATVAGLRAKLGPAAALRNPVDMTAMAGPAEYGAALETVLADPEIDAAIGIFMPPLGVSSAAVAEVVARIASQADKPVLATLLGGAREHSRSRHTLPVFAFPEAAAYALAALCGYTAWRRSDRGAVLVPADIDLGAARAVVAAALAGRPQGCRLAPLDAVALLNAVGVPVLAAQRVENAGEALAAATAFGYPVVLKAASPDLVHKADRGGLVTDITSAEELDRAFASMEKRLGAAMGGGIIQPMLPSGVETVVEVVRDRSFGPLVVFGSGGTAVGLLGDQAFRAAPLTDVDVFELLREPCGSALLFGYGGTEPCDIDALTAVITRVSVLVSEVPEIAEMDLSPVIVSSTGAMSIGVKVRLEPQARDILADMRHLPR